MTQTLSHPTASRGPRVCPPAPFPPPPLRPHKRTRRQPAASAPPALAARGGRAEPDGASCSNNRRSCVCCKNPPPPAPPPPPLFPTIYILIFKGKTWPDTSVLTHVDGTPGQLSGITPNQVAAPRPPRSPSGDRPGCSPSARHFYWSRQIGLFQKKLGRSLVLCCNLSPLFFSFRFFFFGGRPRTRRRHREDVFGKHEI